jgi:osmotically inducible protein OsmC
MADRTATVTWRGNLLEGQGTIDTGSGAITGTPVTWASRIEASEGKTSPEELLAASEAECYVMGLTARLSRAGNVPDEIKTVATCTVERGEGGLKITTIHLQVSGRVPNIDNETFQHEAIEAEKTCPVSNALRGNVEISLEANLES